MLLTGINHVAVLTKDTDRLHAFYRDVFDAPVFHDAVDGRASACQIAYYSLVYHVKT